MHRSAHELGRLFFDTHWRESYRTILDVGALDVNGTLRDFCPPGASYLGTDMAAGKGVDLVLKDPHSFPFEDNSFDVILSSSCFEHDAMFWLTFAEACRTLAKNGLFYINVPSNGIYHAYPHDIWRFYPDSGVALEKWGRRCGHDIYLVESFIMGGKSGSFSDCVLIFKKGLPDAQDTKVGLSDKVRRACNVRRFGVGKLTNFSKETEDMIEIARLTRENELLKEKLAQVSKVAI